MDLSFLLLSMTFYDLDVCCFFAGRLVDEVLSVLRLVDEEQKRSNKPLCSDDVSFTSQFLVFIIIHVHLLLLGPQRV